MRRDSTIGLATRGSAPALAQAELVLSQCRAAFPDLRFEMKVIRTTGDKLETASLSQGGKSLPKGLFTKELEVALVNGQADFAVRSLKDLPTALPLGLKLGAVSRRADERIDKICEGLNHLQTEQCVTSERSFLAAMGGGCASPVAAYAEIIDDDIHMRAISFPDGIIRRAFGTRRRNNSASLGRHLAEVLKGSPALQCSDGGSDGPSSYAHRESPAGV